MKPKLIGFFLCLLVGMGALAQSNQTCIITLNCPGDIVVLACTNGVVNYSVTAFDSCGGPIAVSCIPPSGTLFSPGTTAVRCTATNASGDVSNCVFTVSLECQDSGCCSNSAWMPVPLTNHPSARQQHALAYDSVGGVAVLFGGTDSSGVAQGDTWLWDGAEWQQVFPATSPSPRYGHAMAYDEARERVVLYGGTSAGGTMLGDTWEWDGVNWSLRPAGSSPGPRAYHAMAYDPIQDRVLLYGGSSPSVVEGDSWEWTGADWVLVAPNGAGPSARFSTAMAADPLRRRVVLFGGALAGFSPQGDTWEWNGAAWSPITVAGAAPTPRYGHDMAFGPGCAQVLLFGGASPQLGVLSDTWLWDGSGWNFRSSSGPSPAGYLKLATAPQNTAVTLFGGANGTNPSRATWKWGCSCPDDEMSLDADGNPVFPDGFDTNLLEFVEVNRPLGTLDQLYPEWDTSVDTWYTNLPCKQSIGGILPTNASNPDLLGPLAEIGITNVSPEEISITVSNWARQIAEQVATETNSFLTAGAVGPPYYPPARPHCIDPNLKYAFGGRDIIFVHGLQIGHLAAKVMGNPHVVPWVTPTVFPGSIENPEFYQTSTNVGYFKRVAESIILNHMGKFLLSQGYRNRYLIVAYPCTERLEVGTRAVLTQISDAMHFGTGVVDLSGHNDTSNFGTPSFVAVSHSTGALITDAALSAAALHPGLNAGYIPRLCKAHVAMDGAFSGSGLATTGVALSGIIGPPVPAHMAWGCLLMTHLFSQLDAGGPSASCGILLPVTASSVLVDLVPQVAQTKWGPYLQRMPVRTITVIGGNPSFVLPLKRLVLPGFDDGVLTIDSQVANPNSCLTWPSGFITSGSPGENFDLGLARKLDSPTRAIHYFSDQMGEPLRLQRPPFVAGAATPYISPTGMRQNVAYSPAATSTLNRYPNHYSYLQSASDHLTGYSGSAPGGWNGQDYWKTINPTGHPQWIEPNREESRVITDPAVYDPYPMWYPGDDAPLLKRDCVPKVETWERGLYVKPVKVRIGRRTIKLFKGKWIWRRVYDLLQGWETKMGCDYMYETILQCSPVNACPTCFAPPADLALWLSFDETSGSTARNLAGGSNGTLQNGPAHIIPDSGDHTTPIGDYNGGGLCFDGLDDSVTVPAYPAINVGTNDLTLDAWVLRDPSDVSSPTRVILDKRAPASGIGYSLVLDSGSLLFQMSDGVGSPGYSNYRDTAAVPADGLWHFVAVSVSRSSASGGRFYVDGNPTSVFDPTAHRQTLDNTTPLMIGNTPLAGVAPWMGCIDEVELFARALSAVELRQLYSARWAGKCKFACHVPAVITVCTNLNSVTATGQICNYSLLPQAFTYSFQGCTAGQLPAFAPASGTVTVAPGQCLSVPVTITRPNGNAPCVSFCYLMTAQPAGSSDTVQSSGVVNVLCEPCPQAPPTLVGIPVGSLGAVSMPSFPLFNSTGSDQVVPCRWIVLNAFGLVDVTHVSLNGLPPGTPATQVVILPSGGATDLSVSVRFVQPDPLGFYSVVLQRDVGNTGAWESLASHEIQNVEAPVGGTGDAWVFQQPVVEQGQITIQWTGPAGGVLLEAADLPGSTTTWTAVTNAPSTTNGTYSVTLPAQHPRRFYRLEQPH